jgi:O-antigen/teichoic acid export membrane protein
MTMTAHQSTAAWVMGLSAVANVVLNAALIPIWGTTGAAIATAASIAAWNIILVIQVRRRLGIRTTAF